MKKCVTLEISYVQPGNLNTSSKRRGTMNKRTEDVRRRERDPQMEDGGDRRGGRWQLGIHTI
jgi:hypothetical protein